MEMIEKNRIAKERRKRIKICISIILGIIAFISLAIGFGGSDFGMAIPGEFCALALLFMWIGDVDKGEDDLDFGDKVKVPSSISGYENKNYAAIESMFLGAGFTNVKCIPLKDLTTGLLKKPGMVESIIINGKEVTSGGKKFPPDASVVISYHSFSNR